MMNLVHDTLSRFVADGQIAGCAAKIIRFDQTCFEGCFGYANLEDKVPISDDTIFPIASKYCFSASTGIFQLLPSL